MTLEQLLKEKNPTILDVRTPQEFAGGNVNGSINIPLQELSLRIDEIKNLSAPYILCCASGGRSGMAHQLLNNLGLESYNGGSWLDVNYYQNNLSNASNN